MKHYVRKATLGLVTGAALAAGSLAPASAAPVVTGGLVNVTVVDAVDVNNTQIQVLNGVTVAAAAVICGINVQALVVDLGPDGFVSDCNANQDITTTVTQARGR